VQRGDSALLGSEGHGDMVAVLLDAGADPNLKNKDENTPLHVAAAEGREDVVKRLVQKGADVAALNKQRWQPSHWAAAGGHASVLKQLVLSGADLHATTSTGHTCLHLCATAGASPLFQTNITAFLLFIRLLPPQVTPPSCASSCPSASTPIV
jgi:ankyrin repeat protein